ncbi:YjfI family protein [Oceanisphaera sp. KMM 10153]|uniref:YjfI family protein n=1 Tax=Oceanisphaera submarina TaxID=3390193 RepID=UPI0039750597
MSWTLAQLHGLLSGREGWQSKLENDSLLITNTEGLEAYLAVAGEQIIVETLLFPAAQVTDSAGLNDTVLRTHQLFPLTTVGISKINGDDYYIAFGSLSASSKEESVLIEVETLFRNTEAFLDLYQDHLQGVTA